ncbi:hypothetical protein HDV00_010395, partial [Rhizophlyctis rosea]
MAATQTYASQPQIHAYPATITHIHASRTTNYPPDQPYPHKHHSFFGKLKTRNHSIASSSSTLAGTSSASLHSDDDAVSLSAKGGKIRSVRLKIDSTLERVLRKREKNLKGTELNVRIPQEQQQDGTGDDRQLRTTKEGWNSVEPPEVIHTAMQNHLVEHTGVAYPSTTHLTSSVLKALRGGGRKGPGTSASGADDSQATLHGIGGSDNRPASDIHPQSCSITFAPAAEQSGARPNRSFHFIFTQSRASGTGERNLLWDAQRHASEGALTSEGKPSNKGKHKTPDHSDRSYGVDVDGIYEKVMGSGWKDAVESTTPVKHDFLASLTALKSHQHRPEPTINALHIATSPADNKSFPGPATSSTEALSAQVYPTSNLTSTSITSTTSTPSPPTKTAPTPSPNKQRKTLASFFQLPPSRSSSTIITPPPTTDTSTTFGPLPTSTPFGPDHPLYSQASDWEIDVLVQEQAQQAKQQSQLRKMLSFGRAKGVAAHKKQSKDNIALGRAMMRYELAKEGGRVGRRESTSSAPAAEEVEMMFVGG